MKNRPKGFLSEDNIFHGGEIFDYIKELHEYLWRFVRVAFPGASGHLEDQVDQAIELMEATTGPVLIITIRNGVLQHVIANERNTQFILITDGVPAPPETAEYDHIYVQQAVTKRMLIVSYPVGEVANWMLNGKSVLQVITDYVWEIVKAAHVHANCHVEVVLEGNRFCAYLVQD